MNSDKRFGLFVISVTSLASFLIAFMSSAINIALPVIGLEFHSGAVLLSWLATAYILTAAVLLIPLGKLSDIYGRSKFLKIGIFVFTVGSLLCGLSGSDTELLIFRLIQGLGSSFVFVTLTAILVSAFSLKERGKILGINVTAVYVGLSSGPFIGGIITHNIGWRYIFYFSALIGAAIFILLLIKLRTEWKEAKGEKFDLTGSVIYVMSLTLIMLGLTFLPGFHGIALLVISALVIYAFFKVESGKEYPVFNVKVFISNRTFTFSNLSALINYSATFAITFLLSIYLQNVEGLTAQHAGLILVTQPLIMAVFSPIAGRLSDKFEPQIVASAGMALLTIGLVIFAFINTGYGFVLIVINLALVGFGFALFSSPNANAIMSSIEKKYYGVASSTLASMRMIGQMFSMGIVIVIFALLIGKSVITPEHNASFMHSLRVAFIIFSVLCFIGIFTSLLRGKIHDG
jgi:EmrB/QacA subfamily drug resistance transporter